MADQDAVVRIVVDDKASGPARQIAASFDDVAKATGRIDAGLSRMGGTGIRDAARIAQDLQGGFGGILNNLVEIAPALGAAGLGVYVISQNAEKVADAIGRWRDSLDDSQQGFKENLTIVQETIRAMDLSGTSIRRGLGSFLTEFFPEISGLPQLGRAITPDVEADADRAATDAAMKAMSGILGQAEQDRRKALRESIAFLGGDQAFRGILTGGMGPADRDAAIREVGEALTTGSATAFGNVMDILGRQGQAGAADVIRGFLPDLEYDQMQAALDASNARRQAGGADRRAAAKDAEKAAREGFFADLADEFGIVTDPIAKALQEGEARGQEIVDRYLTGDEADTTRRAEAMARAQMKAMERAPQFFGDFGSFLQSAMTAGPVDVQREANELLTTLTKQNEEWLRIVRDQGFGGP